MPATIHATIIAVSPATITKRDTEATVTAKAVALTTTANAR